MKKKRTDGEITKHPQKLDHFKCTSCGVRYDKKRKTCFSCGKSDTIHFNRIEKVPKKKSTSVGATLTINVRSK